MATPPIHLDDPYERAQALLTIAANELEKTHHRVWAANRAVLAADELLLETIAHARWAGRTWGHIGDVIGTTKQAAHQRFAHRLPAEGSPEHRRYLGIEQRKSG